MMTVRLMKACGLSALCLVAAGSLHAASPYPTMAPLSEYLIASPTVEIALARTGAPPSISNDADVLVLGPTGYVTAAKGTNGFTCLVERAWFSGLKDDGFWNPKLRAPICYNRQAARSVLPTFLTRTMWVIAGASQAQLLKKTRAATAAGQIGSPEIGSMTFMMSKDGYLGDRPHGPWHSHLMFYMPPMRTADWGADLPGTRVFATEAGVDPYTLFYVPVPTWSDGSADEVGGARHSM